MEKQVSKYLSRIGRQGGKKSRRPLTSQEAKRMVQLREARRAFKKYQVQCFWSCDPNYPISYKDIPWVAEQLMKHGDQKAWRIGKKLCR